MLRNLFIAALLAIAAGFTGTAEAQTVVATNSATDTPTAAAVAPPVNITGGAITITGGPLTLVVPSNHDGANLDQHYTPQGCGHPVMRCFVASRDGATAFAVVSPDDKVTFHSTPTQANMAAARAVATLSDNVLTNRIRELQTLLADVTKERDAARAHLAMVQAAASAPPPAAGGTTRSPRL